MSVVDHSRFLGRLKSNGVTFDVIYDIGSNIGFWATEIQKTFPAANFQCFEPLIGKNPELDSDARYSKLDNFQLHPVALSNYTGKIPLKVLDNKGVGSSILVTESDYRKKGLRIVDVDVVELDKFVEINGLPKPEFIKLDTQGSELKILEGAKKNFVLYEMLSLEEGRDADQTLRWFDAVFVNREFSHFGLTLL